MKKLVIFIFASILLGCSSLSSIKYNGWTIIDKYRQSEGGILIGNVVVNDNSNVLVLKSPDGKIKKHTVSDKLYYQYNVGDTVFNDTVEYYRW